VDPSQISKWIARIESLYQGEFKDLSFLQDRNGQLIVPATSESWSFLRFELPCKQFLHLHSIDLRDADGRSIAGPDVGLAASSHYGPSLKLLRARKVLDPEQPYRFGVHTLKDERPWLQVSLPTPHRLSDIRIQNRKEANAIRAKGVVVSASADGLRWALLYDGNARLREFRERATRLDAESLTGDDGAKVREMVIDVMTCEYESARKQFSSASFPAAMREGVQTALSDIVLKQRELEWTSHGARRSFRFWSEQEKIQYIGLACDLVRDLHGLSNDACLGFGSVLSVVRDKDLVAHDDDLDIVVAFPQTQARTLAEARRITKAHLDGLGYQVTGNFFSHWHVRRQGRKLDVFVGIYEQHDRIGWFPGKRQALKREEVFPVAIGNLLGVDCAIPRNPERYLEVIYGPNWRSPDPGWKHDWDHAPYQDIA
jgi:hypothetical protein